MSDSYLDDLADALEEGALADGISLGPTDCLHCASALKAYAKHRSLKLHVVAAYTAAVVAIGAAHYYPSVFIRIDVNKPTEARLNTSTREAELPASLAPSDLPLGARLLN
ncbi:hypothetical protein [Methylobacterium sp. WCS2018Hpa-22]|uniref:hypothetical protein n=1 Tax=Methylobacterium sp. WCS2018Hpa-22 TaxID=3073633 RepID=UPI00288B701E|nr:hypothetical protein [Methylobacterium sp. WCS2018Hpa-22]